MKTKNPIDIEIKGTCRHNKPFHAQLEGRFTSPSGKVLRIPGFYTKQDIWKIRFSPTERGIWNYSIASNDIEIKSSAEGTLDFSSKQMNLANNLKVSQDKRHFVFNSGEHHFMNAYECDWLWAMDQGSDSLIKTEGFLDQIQSHKFNTVIMNVYAHDCNWTPEGREEYTYTPPVLYAWGGNNENPDHDQMNNDFFDHFDRVMDLLHQRKIMVHLFFKVYNKMVNYPAIYTPQDDLYFRYITARYQGYDNIVWDFSKESKNEPDKKYILNRLNYIKSLDAYNHLVTTHDDPGYFTEEEHIRSIDFYTAQQHSNFFYSAMMMKERYNMPYFNSEFQYEHGEKGITDISYGVSQTPEESILRAYEVVLAGAYPAYYYTYTAWNAVDYRYDPPGAHYFEIMHDFITSLDWWNFKPSMEVIQQNTAIAMVNKDLELVVFSGLKDRKRASVFLTAPWNYTQYSGYWMNIYTGEKVPLNKKDLRVNQKGLMVLNVPFDSQTGILYLKKEVN